MTNFWVVLLRTSLKVPTDLIISRFVTVRPLLQHAIVSGGDEDSRSVNKFRRTGT